MSLPTLFFSVTLVLACGANKLPEVGLEVDALIQYYGYTVETHQITTEDGYVLSTHRIPHQSTEDGYRGVAFLMPGLFGSSSVYALNGEEKSLVFVLTKLGYDTWVANPRGTTHSRNHLTLDPDDDKSQFWDYSFHDIGYYDIPANIDYILQTTGQEKLYYIGHSQGTSSFFAMSSERPEYNEKIRLMVALAPIAFMGNIPSPTVQLLSKNEAFLKWVMATVQFYELVPHYSIITELGQQFCNDEAVDTQPICAEIFYSLGGRNEKQLNKTRIPVSLSTFPAGASVKCLLHYSQSIQSGKFRRYDYGLLKNLVKYGQLTPPEYNLKNVDVPIAMLYGANDNLAAVEDVETLASKLPNVVFKLQVEDDEFSHLDFMTAIDVNPLVHRYIIQMLNEY